MSCGHIDEGQAPDKFLSFEHCRLLYAVVQLANGWLFPLVCHISIQKARAMQTLQLVDFILMFRCASKLPSKQQVALVVKRRSLSFSKSVELLETLLTLLFSR